MADLDLSHAARFLRPQHRDASGHPVGPAAAALIGARRLLTLEGSPDQLRDETNRRLTELCSHARRHSTFWRERIPASVRDLRDVPTLRRQDVVRQVEREGALPVPGAAGESQRHATSGSTGTPVAFHVTGAAAAYNALRYFAAMLEHGLDPTLPFTMLRWGVSYELAAWPGIVGSLFASGPARCFDSSGKTVEAAHAWLMGAPVGYLSLPPIFLSGLLDIVEAGGPVPRAIAAVNTWAMSVDDELRMRTRRLLGHRIVDRYSCEETGPIAIQCPRSDAHMHVATSGVLAEVVDDDGRPLPAGELGRILVTSFNSHATPFIRYEPGDLGRLLPRCPCGHPGATLLGVVGREIEFLHFPDGRRSWLRVGANEWETAAPVREFRIAQTDARRLKVEIVPARPLSDDERARAIALIAGRAPGFEIELCELPRIDWGPGYKRHAVVTMVPPRAQPAVADPGLQAT